MLGGGWWQCPSSTRCLPAPLAGNVQSAQGPCLGLCVLSPVLQMWLGFTSLRILQKTPFPGRLAVLQTRTEIQKLVLKGAGEEDKQGEAEAGDEEGDVPCRWRT